MEATNHSAFLLYMAHALSEKEWGPKKRPKTTPVPVSGDHNIIGKRGCLD
jgi:hypothetical protein